MNPEAPAARSAPDNETPQGALGSKNMSREALMSALYNDFIDAEAEGNLTNPRLVYVLAKRYGVAPDKVVKAKTNYELEYVKKEKEILKLQRDQMDMAQHTTRLQLDNCPMCERYRSDLESKITEFKEHKAEMKEEVKSLKDKIEKLEEQKRALESDKLKLEISKPQGEMPTELRKLNDMIYQRGFDQMTNPRTSSPEDLVKLGLEKAPEVLDKMRGLAKDLSADNPNPYPTQPPTKAKRQQKIPKPQKPQKLGEQMPKPQTNPPPRAPVANSQNNAPNNNGLNGLGKSFHKHYPQVPSDQVKIASDHIMKTYGSLGPEICIEKMNDTFELLQNVREIGVHVRNIVDRYEYPVLNRSMTPADAAEWLWKQKSEYAKHLANMTYEEFITLLYPFKDHPTYIADYTYLVSNNAITVVEMILGELNVKMRTP